MYDIKLRDVQKGLTMLAVEKSLLGFNPVVYDKVLQHLEHNYASYLSDCLDDPQTLRETLTELYARSYYDIVNKIAKELYEFRYQKPIERFLVTLDPKFAQTVVSFE